MKTTDNSQSGVNMTGLNYSLYNTRNVIISFCVLIMAEQSVKNNFKELIFKAINCVNNVKFSPCMFRLEMVRYCSHFMLQILHSTCIMAPPDSSFLFQLCNRRNVTVVIFLSFNTIGRSGEDHGECPPNGTQFFHF